MHLRHVMVVLGLCSKSIVHVRMAFATSNDTERDHHNHYDRGDAAQNHVVVANLEKEKSQ